MALIRAKPINASGACTLRLISKPASRTTTKNASIGYGASLKYWLLMLRPPDRSFCHPSLRHLSLPYPQPASASTDFHRPCPTIHRNPQHDDCVPLPSNFDNEAVAG